MIRDARKGADRLDDQGLPGRRADPGRQVKAGEIDSATQRKSHGPVFNNLNEKPRQRILGQGADGVS
jgi:hypothetical protein